MSENPEHLQNPSLYGPLYEGIRTIAKLGVAVSGPLDGSQTPGIDGTYKPDEQPASGYSHIIDAQDLPEAIIELGIDHIEFGSCDSTLMEDQIWPERRWVNLHYALGYTTHILFLKEHGSSDIQAEVDTEMDVPSEADPQTDIDRATARPIAESVYKGDLRWLRLDGQLGENARRTYAMLMSPRDLSMENIETLHLVIASLNRKS